MAADAAKQIKEKARIFGLPVFVKVLKVSAAFFLLVSVNVGQVSACIYVVFPHILLVLHL